MKTTKLLVLCAGALVLMSCGAQPSSLRSRLPRQSPTAPTLDPAPIPAPAPTRRSPIGQITLTRATPSAGVNVEVWDCNPTGFQRLCTNEVVLVFEAAADQDVPAVTVEVDFMKRGDVCGRASSEQVSLTANVPKRIDVSSIQLSEGEGAFCELPAVTTGMTVRLLPLVVARDFPNSFTFVLK